MRRVTAISLISGSLLAGIALGRLDGGAGLHPAWIIAAAVAAFCARRTRVFTLGLMLTALTLGLWQADSWRGDQARLTGLIGQKVTLTATIADDPSLTANGWLSFNITHIQLAGSQPLAGTLSVYMYNLQLQRGYRIQATGTIKPGFGNSVAELSFPQLTITSRHQDWLEQFRQRFFVGVKTALPEPLASFGLGLLVGIRALIPKPLQTELALVGLSHLVAVSGYNLTIIVAAVHRLLKRCGRGISLAASLWLMAGFLVVTGASASIVRASLVAVLSLLASYYGRRFDPLALILLTAGATALYNPGYLTDLGWLLSYLAFFGILVVAPAIEARLGHPKHVLVKLFIESCTAQILTIPLILCYFSQLSIIAPITNLVILPLVPLAMAVSFIAGLGGLLLPAFAGWFAWPASLVLGLMLGLINEFAALPWAGRTEHLSPIGMFAMYAVLLIFTIMLLQANRRRAASQNLQKTTKSSIKRSQPAHPSQFAP